MSKRVKHLTIATSLIAIMSAALPAYALDCPPCFHNQKSPKVTGNGIQDGRPIVTVQIDSSWSVDNAGNPQSNTNAAIWNGVDGCVGCVPPDGAIGMWNSARGTGGAVPPYYFKLDQNAQNPNIKIVRDPTLTSCGRLSGVSGGPYTLSLPASATSQDIWALVETLAHELGHSIGLENPDDPNCVSIMNRANPTCGAAGNAVYERDVNQAIRGMNPGTQTGCEANWIVSLHQCEENIRNQCSANGGSWDNETCTCTEASGCDQSQASNCYSNGGTWHSDVCVCDYPDYYYGGDSHYYCEYHCTNYYTCVSDGNDWQCEYQGTDCYRTGCYYY